MLCKRARWGECARNSKPVRFVCGKQSDDYCDQICMRRCVRVVLLLEWCILVEFRESLRRNLSKCSSSRSSAALLSFGRLLTFRVSRCVLLQMFCSVLSLSLFSFLVVMWNHSDHCFWSNCALLEAELFLWSHFTLSLSCQHVLDDYVAEEMLVCRTDSVENSVSIRSREWNGWAVIQLGRW